MSNGALPKFRYFLKADDFTYYYISGNTVLTTTTPTPLKSDPMEWKETDIRWKRHDRFHGIFRSFVVPLSFVNDAAKILRYIGNTQEGGESKCILYIEKKKEHTQFAAGDETYQFYYQGDIDFSKKKNRRLYFQASVLDRGLASIVQAKSTTPFETPIYAGDCIPGLFDGLRLKNTTFITLANDYAATNTWHQMQPTMLIRTSESTIKVDVIEQPTQQGLGSTILTTDFPFYKAAVDGNVTIDFDISIQAGNVPGLGYGVYGFAIMIAKYNAATGVKTPYKIYTDPTPVKLHQAVGSYTIPVLKDETLAYIAGLDPFDPSNGAAIPLLSHTYNYSTLAVHYDTTLDTSVARGYRYHQFFQKFIYSMTDGQYLGKSDFLSNPNLTTVDNKPWNTIVTSGDALRRLAWQPGFWAAFNFLISEKIKTTLDEINNDARDRWMTGIGIEVDPATGNEVVRLEHLSYFYQNNSVAATLDKEVDMGDDYAFNLKFNLLRIGCRDSEYDALNGKDEPSTTHIYSLPLERDLGESDMVSPYRWDMYGIEFVRANLTEKKTTDSKNDNDTFIFEIVDNPVAVAIGAPIPYNGNAYPLARKQNAPGNSATGLLSPINAFNLSLTPKRNLIRNGALIHAVLHQQDSKVIKFQTTDKNADLESNLGSGSIKERDDVAVSGLAAPLFLPIIFEFETKVPTDLPTLIAQNPYGRINFKWRNPSTGEVVTLGGFILEIGIKPADNAVYTWQLLACPDTPLDKLNY